MATITRQLLNASANGFPIPITNTSSPGTLIHTGPTATGTIDHVYLWGMNSGAANRQLVVQFGGTGTGNDVYVTIPAQDGAYALIPGWPLLGGATQLVVRGIATATGGMNCWGYVNRIA